MLTFREQVLGLCYAFPPDHEKETAMYQCQRIAEVRQSVVIHARRFPIARLRICGLWIIFLFCTATTIASAAQILTTLHNFSGGPDDGAEPAAGLVQATDGNFYGTTAYGGNYGTVFKITPSGTVTILHSFNYFDGWNPLGGLVQASDGNFYGTTFQGGANDLGTVFKITPSGALTVLHTFDQTEGRLPVGALVQASDGNLYGTTSYSGNGAGTVFKITPSGTLTTLYSFGGADGADVYAGLIQGNDGNFYGTTNGGGAYCPPFGCGTVFKITPGGTLTTLYNFCAQSGCPDGSVPVAGLVRATDGNFYGTTQSGGTSSNCSSSYNGCGTVFKITPSGALTTLYSFDLSDGANPIAALVQASDGNLYGTTYYGGAHGSGTVFRITPSGTLTTLYSFGGPDGSSPSTLVQAIDGAFYGTTEFGGTYPNNGTVFRLILLRACVICPMIDSR